MFRFNSNIRSAVTFASRCRQCGTTVGAPIAPMPPVFGPPPEWPLPPAAYDTRPLVVPNRPYRTRPYCQIQGVDGRMINFGSVIEGHDFSSPDTIDENMKHCLAETLKESCFLLIKGQHKQFGDGRTQCAIAEALGTLLEGTINHHSAVRNAVIRISNDPEDGNLVNEAAWWHTDMLPSPMPVQYTSLFMVANDAPLGAKFGVTKLVPSDQFYKRQSAETQEAWNKRQWGLDVAVHATLGKGVPANKSVPMIHTHPHKLSNNVAVNIETEPECTGVFDVLPGGGREFIDKSKFIQEVDDKLEEACEDYGAIVEWEAGDYLIFDNMAVLHKAQADAYQTKEQREAAGLPYYRRTLHRVTCLTDLVRYPQLDEE